MKIDSITTGNLVVIPVCSFLAYKQIEINGFNIAAVTLLTVVLINAIMLIGKFKLPKSTIVASVLALALLTSQAGFTQTATSPNAGDPMGINQVHSTADTKKFLFVAGTVLGATAAPGAGIIGAMMMIAEYFM